ncbi:MAG TPA: hypothetical protein VLF64_00550 [Candidatus Saccharimonadales bacterium]|nr:hypothetical protein [Candidatus Saccharimonadales bacterium]
MPITFVQGNANGDSSSGTVTTCAFTSNVTAGNLLVVAVSFASAIETASVTDSLGNTYSTAVGPTTSNTIASRVYTFYTVTGLSGANTVTITNSNLVLFRRVSVHEYSGVNTLEVATGTNADTGAPDSGPVTTTHANALIFGWGISNNGTTSAGTGFTLRETALSESTEDMIVSSTGTYDAIYPSDGSAWICQVAAFYYSAPAAITVAWLTA